MLPGAPLPFNRLYNLSVKESESMEKYFQESLEAGIIRLSSSPFGADFFFVAKKDGSRGPCIDYRGLNQITLKNKSSLPLLSSTLEPVSQASVLFKIRSQKWLAPYLHLRGGRMETTFKTPIGHFKYLIMPFGLSNALAVFQNLVNDVLRDLLHKFVFVYLDDILIFSKTLNKHKIYIWQVLQRWIENRLYIKAEKCQFHVSSITFLGYILEDRQLRADPEKIQVIKDWPVPENQKPLQILIGFANFYRLFIHNFSKVAETLNSLTSSKKAFQCTPEGDRAFLQLKESFVQAPILS